jgi:hypothetical protein
MVFKNTAIPQILCDKNDEGSIPTDKSDIRLKQQFLKRETKQKLSTNCTFAVENN